MPKSKKQPAKATQPLQKSINRKATAGAGAATKSNLPVAKLVKSKVAKAKPAKTKPPVNKQVVKKPVNPGRTATGKVPQGRTLSTLDKFLNKKAKEPDKKRPVVVIEANDNNDLAVVQLSGRAGKDRTRLKNYQQGQSYFKHYVEIEDNEGKPIRVNDKFKDNQQNMDVSQEDAKIIKDKVLYHSKASSENQKKIDTLQKKE